MKLLLIALLGLSPANNCTENELVQPDGECVHVDEVRLQDGWKFYNLYSIEHPDSYIKLRG